MTSRKRSTFSTGLSKRSGGQAHWQVIATGGGREKIWELHRAAAEQGGNLRTGLEDTFYLPDGSQAEDNGRLVEALAKIARQAGREPATPAEAREILGLRKQEEP